MVVSNPWKLDVSNAFLKSTYIGLNIYSKTMGSNMLRLFEAHKEQITKNTSIKTEEIHKCKYLHDFDRVVQCATVSEPASVHAGRPLPSLSSPWQVHRIWL